MDISKLIDKFNEGITVTPERYNQIKKAKSGAVKILDLAEEVMAEMGPDDDTPYQLTGPELMAGVLGKLGDRLGN